MTYKVKIGSKFYLYKTYRQNGKVKCEYVGKADQEPEEKKDKINPIDIKEQLKKMKVEDASIVDKTISLKFDGKNLRNKIVMKEHLDRVGAWAKGVNEIYFDNDITNPKEEKSLFVHETVEKYVAEQYGLSEKDAHEVAEEVEKEFAEKIGINWANYSREVVKVHEKEMDYFNT
jgi:hypothetical protein